MKTTLETTPIIHKNDITAQKYIGPAEFGNGDYFEIARITAHGTKYLIAGTACNAGLLPDYAMEIEDGETTDEALQEFIEDLESLDAPSGRLLAWRGSLCI